MATEADILDVSFTFGLYLYKIVRLRNQPSPKTCYFDGRPVTATQTRLNSYYMVAVPLI